MLPCIARRRLGVVQGSGAKCSARWCVRGDSRSDHQSYPHVPTPCSYTDGRDVNDNTAVAWVERLHGDCSKLSAQHTVDVSAVKLPRCRECVAQNVLCWQPVRMYFAAVAQQVVGVSGCCARTATWHRARNDPAVALCTTSQA